VRLEISDEDDEMPTFAYGVYTFGTYENQPSGTEVGTVTAVDRDLEPYNRVEYRLQGSGSNAVFEIGRHTGRITIRRPLDREVESEYQLTVVASGQYVGEDGHAGSSTARVKVIVADRNDNRPRFVFPAVANDSLVVARCGLEAAFGRVVARDRDIGANAALRYRLLGSGDYYRPGVEYQAVFDINPLSGVITASRALSDDVVEYPLHVQVRDSGSPPLLADTWLNVRLNCTSRVPAADVTTTSHQLGAMLVVVVMATIASSLLVICIIAGTVVLRHCSADNLRTNSKPEPDHATSTRPPISSPVDRDGIKLKITRDMLTSRNYRNSWYPMRYNNSLKAASPQRCLTDISIPATLGWVRPINGHHSNHVTLNGRSRQATATSFVNDDDVRYRLFYGTDIMPAMRQPVRIRTTACVFLFV